MRNLDEYAFAVCDTKTKVNKYLMSDGYSFASDIESIFSKMESMSVIYISRNAGLMIFLNTQFRKNIGTFGGALTINSPNFQDNTKSYVIIYNSEFINNMAYFSGNGGFIRNTKKKERATE